MSFISNLFKAPQVNFQPQGFNSPGLSFQGGTLTPSAQLQSNLGGLQQTFGQQAQAIGGLANTVQPGFSQLRRAGLGLINNQQKQTQSNLAENLSQRRVLGSSFATAAQSQTDADFAKQKADFAAQSYLQELDASNKLIQEQYQATAQSYSSFINQSNIEADIAAKLTGQNNQIMANIATANAQLDAQNAAGIGKLFGTLVGNSGIFGSGGISSLFGGGGGIGASAAGDVASSFGLDATDVAASSTMADVLPAVLAL